MSSGSRLALSGFLLILAASAVASAPGARPERALDMKPMAPSALRDDLHAQFAASAQAALLDAVNSLRAEALGAGGEASPPHAEHDDHPGQDGEIQWFVPFIRISPSQQGFYSLENAAPRTLTAEWLIVGDSGRLLRSVTVRVPPGPGYFAWVNGDDLMNGNARKGVQSTFVAPRGPNEDAYAYITTPVDIYLTAYLRTTRGFVTGMSDTMERYISVGGWSVEQTPFFNPASNRTVVSYLRIVNFPDRYRTAVISGTDSRGSPSGQLRCRIGPGEAITLSSPALEQGNSRCSGRLGDGTGKWQIQVRPESASDYWFFSMSLLLTNTGEITNLSFPEPYHFTSP